MSLQLCPRATALEEKVTQLLIVHVASLDRKKAPAFTLRIQLLKEGTAKQGSQRSISINALSVTHMLTHASRNVKPIAVWSCVTSYS